MNQRNSAFSAHCVSDVRLTTFTDKGGQNRLGALCHTDKVIIDLNGAAMHLLGKPFPYFSSLQALIEGGMEALETAQEVLALTLQNDVQEFLIEVPSITLQAPLPRPIQIRDCIAFFDHMRNSMPALAEIMIAESADPKATRHQLENSSSLLTADDLPEFMLRNPVYYRCNNLAVIGPEQNIIWPDFAKLMDYELELAAIIGKTGCDISVDEARGHIFGYTIFNDVSARDYQVREMAAGIGVNKSKDFDTGIVLGPCIVTADEIADPHNLKMTARINGEVRSNGSSAQMDFKFEDIIAYVSREQTIYPSEILGSGTVPLGCGLELGQFLSDGDDIELEIESIGILKNKIIKKQKNSTMKKMQ